MSFEDTETANKSLTVQDPGHVEDALKLPNQILSIFVG